LKFTGETEPRKFTNNKIRNQKYYVITFIPVVLVNQFKFFFNLFFLVIALSQFVPFLRVGKLDFTCRFPVHLYCSACFCTVDYNGKGSLG
jgi:magnesium-transporting ATPase (P-type)